MNPAVHIGYRRWRIIADGLDAVARRLESGLRPVEPYLAGFGKHPVKSEIVAQIKTPLVAFVFNLLSSTLSSGSEPLTSVFDFCHQLLNFSTSSHTSLRSTNFLASASILSFDRRPYRSRSSRALS